MSAAYSDRNLLFGVLALQMDFLNRDALIAAMQSWIHDKTRPLGDILIEQHALRPDERGALDVLVQKHLDRHKGDVEKSLAAVNVPPPLREDLRSLADPDVQASLCRMSTSSESDRPSPLPSTVSVAKPVAGLRYQILRPHDKGGIGEVFVALDQELNRQVALKEIQQHHASDTHSRGRFVREAEITGGLEHPGIVPVYGLGQYADGRPFYAMRFIQGETLKDAIVRYHGASADGSGARSPEFEFRALLTRFVAVCNTIAYAHSRGVIHRDIKPSNIMLGKYGETLVVDWGMAKSGMNEPTRSTSDVLPEPTLLPSLADAIQTQAGSAMGTPAYMSPEQASGRLDLLGPASDIYSLGATLYTLLTGRPPIEGKETAEVLRKAQRGEWLSPRQVKPEVPPALDAVCRKAMAPLTSARYATALELAADVERWLADEPVSVYRESWAARSRRWMRRHRTLVSTAVGVLVIALLSTTVGLVFLGDAWDKEAIARKTAEAKKEEARSNEYVAAMNLVQREYEVHNIAYVRELLEAQVPQTEDDKDWRSFEWHYWHNMAHRELLTLEGKIKKWGFHDGSYVRFGTELGSVTNSLGVTYSPDGRYLAAAGEETTVRIWDVVTGQELHFLKGHSVFNPITSVAFSPDGRRLAGAGGQMQVWDTTTGQELFSISQETGVSKAYCAGIAFSPDGRRLAVGGAAGRKKPKPPRVIDPRSGTISVDGLTGMVWVLDAATGKELFTIKADTDLVNCVAFSPDGRLLASAGGETVRVWDSGTGEQLLAVPNKGGSDHLSAVAFSPVGRMLAVASNEKVEIWDSSSGKKRIVFVGVRGARSISFSPDGRRLAAAGGRASEFDSPDPTVRVWEVATGKTLLNHQGHIGPVGGVAFSPDGW